MPVPPPVSRPSTYVRTSRNPAEFGVVPSIVRSCLSPTVDENGISVTRSRFRNRENLPVRDVSAPARLANAARRLAIRLPPIDPDVSST